MAGRIDHRKSLLSQLHMYLNRLDLMEEKRSILRVHTHGRTGSARELSLLELRQLVQQLRDGDPTEKRRAVMVRKLLYLLMEWNEAFKKDGRPNKAAIDAFVQQKWNKKSIWSFSYQELPRIISVVETKFLKHAKRT